MNQEKDVKQDDSEIDGQKTDGKKEKRKDFEQNSSSTSPMRKDKKVIAWKNTTFSLKCH